jgi:hypothetical protein
VIGAGRRGQNARQGGGSSAKRRVRRAIWVDRGRGGARRPRRGATGLKKRGRLVDSDVGGEIDARAGTQEGASRRGSRYATHLFLARPPPFPRGPRRTPRPGPRRRSSSTPSHAL